MQPITSIPVHCCTAWITSYSPPSPHLLSHTIQRISNDIEQFQLIVDNFPFSSPKQLSPDSIIETKGISFRISPSSSYTPVSRHEMPPHHLLEYHLKPHLSPSPRRKPPALSPSSASSSPPSTLRFVAPSPQPS